MIQPTFEIVKNNPKSTAQVIVNEIADWSIQNKFQVQPRKSNELRIFFKNAPSVSRDLYINDTPINRNCGFLSGIGPDDSK